MLFKTFVLILLCSFHPECDSQIQSKEVDCEICSCKTVKIRFAVEFQVTCEGNELTVRKVTFPDEAPERAESGAAIFIFGGLVITNSTINKIPKNLFKKTESVGLKLISSQIGSLNLFEVSQETLNFLDVENSIIDSIKGIPGMSLKFATSPLRSKYQSFIKIKESKIGYIGENSFNFTQIDKYTPAILIWKTTVGFIDTSAIILGKGTIFDLRDSSIGNVLPDGIKFIEENRKESVSIINNFMVVNEDFVKSIKCDNVTEVRDNIFYISNTTNTHSLQNIYSDLIIAVLCLSFYVICKKSRKKQKFHHSDDRTSTCLYEEPNAYFVPKPPQPLKFQNLKTVDKDTDENDRYQVKLGLRSKKGGILCEEESLYLNMS
ncbi:hypothetical protein Avbf_15932 [Armadillidium vulgare]|nr:hypothetical protein Avbf_15932 [Armadillidium vulgare]